MWQNGKFLIVLLIIVGAFISLITILEETSASTIIVAKDGSGKYTRIQDAIDYATEGDTIRVYEGTYYENMVVDKTVNLVGNGSEVTTIDGGGIGDVVKITADWVNMSAFSVTGSGSEGNPNYDAGIKVESDHNRVFGNNCSNNFDGIYLRYSDYNILKNNTCSRNELYGIRLYDSSACKLESNTCYSNNEHGIHLRDSSDCIITNNTCSSSNEHGIDLQFSNDCTIENNTCLLNKYCGIFLLGSSHCTITNNTCSLNNQSGILLLSLDYCILENNLCSNNDIGIRLMGPCDYCILENNTCSRNEFDAIILNYSSHCILKNNTMNENGISISSGTPEKWNSHTIETTNTVNGKPVYYYKNVAGYTVPYGAGQVILANCTWINVENQNCSNGSIGMLIGYSSNITLMNNTCSSNKVYGIYLWASSNCTIMNSTISENRYGIYLSSSSRDNRAYYNNIYNNTHYGIDTSENKGFYINAINNWWGTYNGPYHTLKNPMGNGDNVTYYVEFNPWEGKNIPPEAFINSVSPNPAVEGMTILFTAKGTDDGNIERYSWRIEDTELYNGTNPTFTFSTLFVGTHTIFLKVQDNYSVWSEEVNTTLTILALNKIPTVTIASPKDGDKITGKLLINGTASDEDGTIEKVEISLDGGSWRLATGTDTWTLELVPKDIDGEEITIAARSFDGENFSEEVSITITLENIDDSSDGFIPGFEAMAVVVAIGVAIILYRRKGKKEQH